MKHTLILLVILFSSGCSSVSSPCLPPIKGDVVYVVGRGWHAELGIPVEELSGDLAFYRKVFSGARVIMVGYGKQTFITAPPDDMSEYFLGPVPGRAVIQVVGLRVTPLEAYDPEDIIVLSLPPGGAKALSAYIGKDLAKDAFGKVEILSHSTNPDGLFYKANSEYNLLHTCNTWTADALHEAGLDISSDGVIFSDQVMGRVTRAALAQCQNP